MIGNGLVSRSVFGLFNRVTLPLVAALGIATVAAIVWFPDGHVIRYFHDDAFFVLKTANNMGSGAGSTFDGINLTNGYHPLNLWLFALVSIMVPLEGSLGLDAVIAINMVMTVAGLLLIDHFARGVGLPTYARLFIIISVTTVVAFNDFGLEARLLVPAAWLLMVIALRTALTGNSNTLAFGLVGAVVILSRLDSFIFVLSLALFVSLWQTRPLVMANIKRAIIRFASLILPSVIAIFGYVIYNWTVFSKPQTVSSWLKFGWPITWDTAWLDDPGAYVRVGLCLAVPASFVLLMVIAHFVPKRQPWTPDLQGFQWLLAAANAYTVIYVITILLFMRGEFGSWYLSLSMSISIMTSGYLMVVVFEKLDGTVLAIPSVKASAKIILIVTVLAVMVTFSVSKITRGERNDVLAMGIWMKDNLPSDAKIFQVDHAGFTGYFSELAVINGDGLINSWEYQDYLRSGRLIDYLEKYNVGYMIQTGYSRRYRRNGESRVEISVRLWDEPNHSLSFTVEPEQLARFGGYVLLEVDLSSVVVTRP